MRPAQLEGIASCGRHGPTIERTLGMRDQLVDHQPGQSSLRPHLRASLWDDGEADLIIVEADPDDFAQQQQRSGQLYLGCQSLPASAAYWTHW